MVAAKRVIDVLAALRKEPSGAFVDIRALLDPETYARLYEAR